MQISNPLQMNDWAIRKFLTVIFAIQLAMLGVIGLDSIGLQIPILRQLIAFIYLTFIPGILILRILKLHKLDNIETLLYTVGLSITTLMFTGLFMNTVYPFFGISGPISITPLIITISMIVSALCVLSYVRDRDFSNPSFIDLKNVLSPPVLFLCMIPFLAAFGTYLVNFHHNNILLMFLIILLAIIVGLIAFNMFIPKNLYPLAVFIITISLLYHTSLISMYIWGSDINYELYLTNLLKMNSIWDPTSYGTCNAMLSLVMLAPIYSIISDMSITWIFKIIYPLLFSLVPLGLYRIFQKQTNEKIAFLSCFFFVSIFSFYTEMLALARQQIAELFLVLLILLMIDEDMDRMKRSFLFIVFGISLAVSHYGLSYIYMFCLISAWIILVLGENPAMQKLMVDFRSKFGMNEEELAANPKSLKMEDRAISSTFVLLFITFTLVWYMYVSSSSAFNSIVNIGDHMASSMFTELLNPEAAQGLNIILTKTISPLHSVAKYLHLTAQFFIGVGVITLLLKRKEMLCWISPSKPQAEGHSGQERKLAKNRYLEMKSRKSYPTQHKEMKIGKEYEAFSLINFAICLGGIALPYFASALNTSRLYQITLIFLAPFCVIGGITVFNVLTGVVRVSWPNQRVGSSLQLLSVFFAIFLLFNTGWVYEVAEDHSGSISLSQESIKEYGDTESKTSFYNTYIPEQDVFSAMWLSKNRDAATKIYADYSAYSQILQSYGMLPPEYRHQLLITTTEIETGSYIFMSYANVIYNTCLSVTFEKGRVSSVYNTTDIDGLLKENCRVYSNRGSDIYVNNS